MGEGYGPIPNQRTNCITTILLSNGEKKTLNAGTYVKAIRKLYLPHNHPLEELVTSDKVIVYSPYGLGLINRADLDWNVY
jgi:hypothetical protein